MEYQQTPQQDFKIDFLDFIENSQATIEAADAISVFAKQKLEEKGNNSTEKEDELTKSVNKDSEALLNKFADAADAEEKALQNLIKTYGKKKVHKKLRELNKNLQNFINKSSVNEQPKGEPASTLNLMRALKTKTEKHIQETAPFSLDKFIKGLVNAVMKIFKKSTPKESSDSQMSNSDLDKESPEPQMSNSDRDKALIIQRAIVDSAGIEKEFRKNYKQLSHDELKKYTEEINRRSQEVATAASKVGEEFLDKFSAYRKKINKAEINAATFEANAWLDIYKELKDNPQRPDYQQRLTEAQNKIRDISQENTPFRSKELNKELSTTVEASEWLDTYKELITKANPQRSDYQQKITEAQNKILDISQKNPQFRSRELNKELATTVYAISSDNHFSIPVTQKAVNRTRKVQRDYESQLGNLNRKDADLKRNMYEREHPRLQDERDSALYSVTKLGNINYEHLTPDQQQLHGQIQDMYIKHSLNQVSTLHGTIENAPHLCAQENLTRSAELLKNITALNSTTEEHIDQLSKAGEKQTELEKQHGSPQLKSSNS